MQNEQGPKSPEVHGSEEFLNKIEEEREVVNDRLGFAYQESIIAIPETRQEEYGISRITRRKITKMPKGLETSDLVRITKEHHAIRDKESKPGYEYTSFDAYPHLAIMKKLSDPRMAEIIRETTDGLFPGWHTWSHVMGADVGHGVRQRAMPRFKSEGLYFQPVFPKEVYERSEGGRVTNIVDGWPLKSLFFDKTDKGISARETKEYSRTDLSVFDMSVLQGHEAPWGAEEGPLFAFGGRNKSFTSYIESISKHPEVLEMLRMKNWSTDTEIPITELDPSDRYLEHWMKKYPFLPKEKVYGLVPDYGDIPVDHHTERKNVNWSTTMSLASLKYLISGVAINYKHLHPRIPVVQHPDIKPLRWCQADVGIITTDKNINVLLFE